MSKISTVFNFLRSFLFLGTVCLSPLTWAEPQPLPQGIDYEIVNYGDMQTRVVRGQPDFPWVIYLHGYGGSSLSVFQDQVEPALLKSPELLRFNWLIPESPEKGSWFDILSEDPRVWQESLKSTRKTLKSLVNASKIDPRKIIWGGFSQGAIAAVDYVLHDNIKPAALLINSGIYFNSTDWKPQSPHLQNIRFFQSHDKKDDILPFSKATQLEKLLKSNGLQGNLELISIGHSFPTDFFSQSFSGYTPENGFPPPKPEKDQRKKKKLLCPKLF